MSKTFEQEVVEVVEEVILQKKARVNYMYFVIISIVSFLTGLIVGNIF